MTDFGQITLADVLRLPAVVVALVVGAVFIGVISWLPTTFKRAG